MELRCIEKPSWASRRNGTAGKAKTGEGRAKHSVEMAKRGGEKHRNGKAMKSAEKAKQG